MVQVIAIALNPAIDISCDTHLVQPTRKLRTHNERQHPGGGGINVARVISSLGGDVELLYLSGGVTGSVLERHLENLPIQRHRIETAQATRIAFTVHEEATGLEYRFVPEGAEIDPVDVQPILNYLEVFEGDYMVGSGSLPPGAPVDTYTKMANIATKKGIKFILDTSGNALQHVLTHSSVYFVKPSLGEIEKLVGTTLDEGGVRAAAIDLVQRGSARYVGVTLGVKGAFLASAEGIRRVPARHVPVHSAVGAGDSFVGGLTWSLASSNTIESAFRFGVAAGAAAVMTEGTELCRPEDVFEIYKAACTADSI